MLILIDRIILRIIMRIYSFLNITFINLFLLINCKISTYFINLILILVTINKRQHCIFEGSDKYF